MPPACSYHYFAYGADVSSDLPIPEFSVREKSDNAVVRIRLHAEQSPADFLSNQPWFFDVTREQALLYFSGVAVFRLTAGVEIDVTPVPDADYRLIELYLSGTVFSVLLHQQGKLVFHSSCVAIKGEGAALLVGESGVGKSSLATALYCRGHHFLSDDTCALVENDGHIMVVPAFPMMKVSPEVVRNFNLNEEQLRAVHSTESKLFFPCSRPCEGRAYPVKAIFVLGQGEETSLTPLDARQAMIETVRHTVPTRLLHTTGDKLHFSQCAAVAASVPAFLLKRTSNIADMQGLADHVEQQVEGLCLGERTLRDR